MNIGLSTKSGLGQTRSFVKCPGLVLPNTVGRRVFELRALLWGWASGLKCKAQALLVGMSGSKLQPGERYAGRPNITPSLGAI